MTHHPAPVCPRHPQRVSHVMCQRCNRPACPQCQRPAAVGMHCVDCVNQAKAQARPVVSVLGFQINQRPPLATYVLIGINIAVFVLANILWGRGWQGELALLAGIPDIGVELPGVVPGTEWWRWLTSGFVHFSIIHLAMNMIALFQFGSILESAIGRLRFIALYFVSLLGGSLAIVLLSKELSWHGGASGAIFGLIAAYIVASKKINANYQATLVSAAVWLGLGFVIPGISWQGHLGGAIFGAITMLLMFNWVNRPKSAKPNHR